MTEQHCLNGEGGSDMTFYGKGIVWDKAAGRVLCRFSDGKFDTDDMAACEKLIAAGYKHSGKQPEMAVIAPEVPQKPKETKPRVARAPRKKAAK